jgi:4-amino-4-deoxy-L-arabinose transferase-like glycosyltransferase
MREMPHFGFTTFLGLLLVVAAAAGVRAWYLWAATESGTAAPALLVQSDSKEQAELDSVLRNLDQQRTFSGRAPLAEQDEPTAHMAPGYPWLVSSLARLGGDAAPLVRWLQCGLGALTALCYFFFARRAFFSNGVALLAGLLCAVYPFWVFATAEIADGVLASFLLSACLALGTRGSQAGGAFTSLLFGLTLAALAMVRAALLPFALVTIIWFLWRCRHFRWGWFVGLLSLLGFANGLAPWVVRNYRVFSTPLPVVDSAYLHLWMGNNEKATGAGLDESTLRASLSKNRLGELLGESNQARRYGTLGKDVLDEIRSDPVAAWGRRLQSAQAFLLGQIWHDHSLQLGVVQEDDDVGTPPQWLSDNFELLLLASLVLLLTLAFLGWRWTYAWAWHCRMATLAAFWIPLPYVLSHAEFLSGPRLPLDGVLLCYAAYAVCVLLPGFQHAPDAPSVAAPPVAAPVQPRRG